MATIYEVSELAGVSLATVSRVMNNSTKVSPKTRKKVESAMKELGYRPNSIAQSLASSRSNSVGILIPLFSGPFFGEMLGGIEAELREAGKHAIITAGHSDEKNEIKGIEFLLSRNCDVLILYADRVSDEFLVELNEGDVPIVILSRVVPGLEDRCITLDNEHGSYLATRSALVLGHTRLAYISGPLWKKDSNERLAGHKRALADFGVEFDSRLMVEGDYQEDGGNRGMEQLLQTGLPFSVVVCANDETAAGVVGVAREKGMSIPDEVSVIGFDNVFFTRYFRPKLSTVNYPIKEMGQMASRCVLRNYYGQKQFEIQNVFQPSMVMRSSVSCKTGKLRNATR
jgi:LacI family transcriptional regulator